MAIPREIDGMPAGRPSDDGLMLQFADVTSPSGHSHPRCRVAVAVALLATACAQNDHYAAVGPTMEGPKNTPSETVRPPLATGPRTEETGHMPSETAYMGRTIYLTATQNANGHWTGSARLPDEPDRVMDANGEFATPDEARKAALSRAISEIDYERRFRGKP